MNLNVYIGWDYESALSYNVARYSILDKTSGIDVIPIDGYKHLVDRPTELRDGVLWCPIADAPAGTGFSITRFVVPFIQKKGWSLFIDPDIICTGDIKKLFKLADDRYAVMVVKHNHSTGAAMKDIDKPQTYYARKNWSSVVLWNCEHEANKRLTIEDLNTKPGRWLHGFYWLRDEEIGELPTTCNYLVGVNEPIENPLLIHYTLGGAWEPGWNIQDSDKEWMNAFKEMKKRVY